MRDRIDLKDFCCAAACVRQVQGKKSFFNFQIQDECHKHQDDSCKYPKYVRREPVMTKSVGNTSPESHMSLDNGVQKTMT